MTSSGDRIRCVTYNVLGPANRHCRRRQALPSAGAGHRTSSAPAPSSCFSNQWCANGSSLKAGTSR